MDLKKVSPEDPGTWPKVMLQLGGNAKKEMSLLTCQAFGLEQDSYL